MNLIALGAYLIFCLLVVVKDHQNLKNYKPVNRIVSYTIIGLSIAIWIYTISPMEVIHPTYAVAKWLGPFIPVPTE
ncbi:hypothetical protein M3231_24465 [Neobacillus mesonae]|nr:hypothetical protein [Neobacillus mesonae]